MSVRAASQPRLGGGASRKPKGLVGARAITESESVVRQCQGRRKCDHATEERHAHTRAYTLGDGLGHARRGTVPRLEGGRDVREQHHVKDAENARRGRGSLRLG